MNDYTPRPRGFAAMTADKRAEVSRKGGRAAHASGRAHQWCRAAAKEAGAKGGRKISQDAAHMAAIGRKGGLARGLKVTPGRAVLP